MKGEKLIDMREGNAIKMIPLPKLSRRAGIDKGALQGKKTLTGD